MGVWGVAEDLLDQEEDVAGGEGVVDSLTALDGDELEGEDGED